MKRTPIDRLPDGTPESIKSLCEGAEIFDSSCSKTAKVYFIGRDGGYYLKTAEWGTLKNEAVMTEYFGKKGIGASVLSYTQGIDADWLLTSRVRGEDCTHAAYISEPRRLCDITARLLRELHETDCSDCPIKDKMTEYIDRAERNFALDNYSREHFPDNFGYRTPNEAWSALQAGKNTLQDRVLLHGDYCLPNIMLDGWRFSGYIDVGAGGVGDRHIDLFWGAWSLAFNLGTNEYRERFFDAYGRAAIDEDKLKVIAAAEVFR